MRYNHTPRNCMITQTRTSKTVTVKTQRNSRQRRGDATTCVGKYGRKNETAGWWVILPPVANKPKSNEL